MNTLLTHPHELSSPTHHNSPRTPPTPTSHIRIPTLQPLPARLAHHTHDTIPSAHLSNSTAPPHSCIVLRHTHYANPLLISSHTTPHNLLRTTPPHQCLMTHHSPTHNPRTKPSHPNYNTDQRHASTIHLETTFHATAPPQHPLRHMESQ